MRFLVVHQNAPAQYRHIIKHLVALPGTEVVVLSQKNGRECPGARRIEYEVPPGTGSAHRWLRVTDDGLRTAEAAMRSALDLKRDGFTPDVILGHNAWGETLFLKDVWPSAKLLSYFEYFYQARGGDSGFDPEFPSGFDDFPRTRAMNALNLLGLHAADWGQTPTRFQRDRYPEVYHPKISIFHEGVDTRHIAPNPRVRLVIPDGPTLTPDDEVITYVSRSLEPYRGFHVFMRTLPEILRRRPNAKVIVIGGDDVSYGARLAGGKTFREALLEEQQGRIDLERVFFLGRVPYDYYLGVLQVSSVHIYLTYPFVLSWSMLESMSAGCLVVGSRTAPVMEVIEHGVNGLLTDFFDRAELADRIDEALSDRDRAAELRRRARETVQQRYDLTTICMPQYLRVIEDLLNGRTPPAGHVPVPIPAPLSAGTVAAEAPRADLPSAVTLRDAISLAVKAEEEGDLAQAERIYRTILAQRPDIHGVHYKLGILLYRRRQYETAVAPMKAAVRLEPTVAHYVGDLGVVYKQLRRFEERLVCYERAVLLNPANGGILMNYGSALIDAGRIRQAARVLTVARSLEPHSYGILTNLGNALMRLGRLDEAVECYSEALALQPESHDTRKNLGMCLLQMGRIPDGAPHYEARKHCSDYVVRDLTGEPWDGRPMPGGTLLLHCEQGLGDTIHFSRYAALARQRAGRVVLEAQAPLVPLLRRLDGVDEVVPLGGPLPRYDAYLPLLSSMLAFGTTLDSIPARIPYLTPDPEKRARWMDRLAAETRLKVGIAWAGSPTFAADRHRTVPLETFAPVLAEADVAFYSLQVGPAREEIARSGFAGVLSDMGGGFEDFDDTAAFVDNLDLVICVDTAVAHLAGAIGRPVWIAIAYAATDWRWLTGRTDSPWYPTARLFRQDEDVDWNPVFSAMAAGLRDFSNGAR